MLSLCFMLNFGECYKGQTRYSSLARFPGIFSITTGHFKKKKTSKGNVLILSCDWLIQKNKIPCWHIKLIMVFQVLFDMEQFQKKSPSVSQYLSPGLFHLTVSKATVFCCSDWKVESVGIYRVSIRDDP